ncbi:MAG TPA: hypothetical protein VHX18_04750 [Rhizomicrobium sp.]|jgi:hypothetical protein|nr:hypothetical protein [Rhizomicrobium sp.]
MKFATVLTLGFLTFTSQAFADVNAAPLAPGKHAGVHNAQFEGSTGMLVVAGAALIGITAALASAGSGTSANNTAPGSTSTSTSTTGTTP